MEKYSHYELYDLRNLIAEYGIIPDRLFKAIEVLELHFSTKWLSELAAKPKRDGSPLSEHPIKLGLLDKVINETTLMLIELATYLEGISNFANFADIIVELKSSDQFYNAFYTVAIAYRLSLQGIKGKFNPSLGNKTPDISIEINNKMIYVETTMINFPSYFASLANLTHNLLEHFMKTQNKCQLRCHLELEYKANSQNQQEIMKAISNVTQQPTTAVTIENDKFKLRIIPITEITNEEAVRRHGEEGEFSWWGTHSTIPGEKDNISTWNFSQRIYSNAFFIKFPGALERDIEELIIERAREKHNNYKKVIGNAELYVFVNLPHQHNYALELLDTDELKRKFNEKYLNAREGTISGIVVTQQRPTDLKRWQIHYMPFINIIVQHLLIGRLMLTMAKLDRQCNFYYPTFIYLPARNDACGCGSGKKFKRCCDKYKKKLNIVNI